MSKSKVRDPKLYVKEIIEHTEYIEEYTKGFTYTKKVYFFEAMNCT